MTTNKYRIVERRDGRFYPQERQWFGLWRTINEDEPTLYPLFTIEKRGAMTLESAEVIINDRIERLKLKRIIIHYFG